MKLKSISINNWNQFGELDIELHPRLTILTGANGTGKSTVIRLLGNMIGWHYSETATPTLDESSGIEKLMAGITQFLKKEEKHDSNKVEIGSIIFEEGEVNLSVPNTPESVDYDIEYEKIDKIPDIKGVFIPSHKVPYSYRKVTNIPVKPLTKKEAFESFNNSIKEIQTTDSFINLGKDSPTLQLKSTLMSLAIFGEGNKFVNRDEEAYKLFLGFVEVLHKLLPESLGFKELNIKNGEIVLVTDTGDFLIDAVSGGIGALIDLAWQIYMFDDEGSAFVVITDEPENHLHPSMQRSLLPNLLDAFPNAQFVLATHSPFVVSSVKDSNVYAFKYNENNQVFAEKLDFENKAGNATEVLREVLGVPVTLPVWVEEKIENVLEDFRGSELTAQSYKKLKEELKKFDLEDYLPQALGSLSKETKND